MCGLLGFTGHGKADPGKIRVLFLENESRGSHSTGMWGSDKNRLMRKVGGASDFIKDANFDSIARSNVVIGHTRFSTGTAKTKENAHPFVFGMPSHHSRPFIVGSHNGSIFNEYEMEQKIENFKRAEVDSKSLFKAMYHTGNHEIFSMAEGHVAIAFYFNGTMMFYRRESRPLYLGKAREGYYYSSLKEGLRKISIPDENIMVLNPHKLIGFYGSKMVYRSEIKEPRVKLTEYSNSYNWDNGLSNELKEELTGKKHYPVTHTGGTGENYSTNTKSQTTTQGGANSSKMAKARVLTREEMRNSQTSAGNKISPIYGRNILLPSSYIGTSEAMQKFIVSRSETISSNLIDLVDNKFESEIFDSMFWVSKHKQVMAAEMSILANWSLVTNGATCLRVGVLSLANKNTVFTTSQTGGRKGLYLFAKISKDCVKKDRFPYSTFSHQAIAYSPICSSRRNEDGFIDICIPPAMIPNISDTSIKIDLFITDLLYSEGFGFVGSVNIKKNSTNYITAIIDLSKENAYNAAINTGEINSSFKTPIGFGVLNRNMEKMKSYISVMKIKGESDSRESIMVTRERTDRKEYRNLFQAYSLQNKAYFYDEDKKKEKQWD